MLLRTLSYGFLTAPAAMGLFVLVTYVPAFYAVDLGLGFAVVGLIVSVGRIIDAFTDPLIGYFSDNSSSRFGARVPWVIPGLFLYCLSSWLLFAPVETISPTYFLFVSSLFFISYTIFEVPYASTGLEVSNDTYERTLYAGSRAIFQITGLITAATIFAVFGDYDAAAMQLVAKLIFVTSLVGGILYFWFVPQRPITSRPERLRLRDTFTALRQDTACLRLIIAYLLVQASGALVVTLSVLFIRRMLETPNITGFLFLLFFVSSAVFLPFWVWLSKRYGKVPTWRIAIITGAFFMLLPGFMGVDDNLFAMLFFAGLGAAFSCDAVMPTSILADLVAERKKRDGTHVAGQYLSLKNMVAKLAFVVPLVIAFPLLEFAGFAQNSTVEHGAYYTFLALFSALPAIIRLTVLKVMKVELSNTWSPAG